MLPNPDVMTARPFPSQPPNSANGTPYIVASNRTPVSALKELVACLHREQHKIQDLLSSLGFALRSFNNLNQFLELIPLMSARVTDTEGGALVLLKPNGQLRLEQMHCQDNQECQTLRPALERATQTITVQGNEDGKWAMSPEQLDAIWSSFDDQINRYLDTDIQLFGTPILIKNVERGRLYVFTDDLNYSWTPTRQKLVRLVADQTAVAIANDELTVELRKKERLDRELEIGAEIQLRLLPRQCPSIKGIELAAQCQTASRVGGDYYDFIPTNYDQLRPTQPGDNQALDQHKASVPWSVVIGDVMGKGVPAGLIMTMTRGMLRAEVLNRHSPARILEHLNRVMYADLENSNRFVTLFYSEYDPQTRTLSYSNAAHNPPFLWKASTHSIQRLDTDGMLIGLEADSQYEDDHIQLDVGDTIIYYTDGFTDVANQQGDRFDEENLIEAFKWACEHRQGSQLILDYLFERVGEFMGGKNRNGDDMTLVVLQVKSSE